MDKLPDKLWQKLLPFQKEGVKFAFEKDGKCLIADEMGLGKTLQAITIACVYKEEWPLLIITPSSLKFSWIEELEKWLPDILPNHINLVHSGNDASGINNSPISIVSYGLLRIPSSVVIRTAITARQFNIVICDESHYLKNNKSLSAKLIIPIIKSAKRKILLSGTPALAKPVELYPQIDAICPGKFGSFWQFTDRYCDAHTVFYGKARRHRKIDGASNLEELQKKMHSLLMIRREKSEVLTELPPKQRQRVLFELKESTQRKEILHRFDQLKHNITKGNTFFQLLAGQESVTGQSEEDMDGSGVDGDGVDRSESEDTSVFREISTLYKLSGEAKIGPVRDYIEMLCENHSLKFLVFAYHHAMMDGIQQSLHDKNIKFVRIDGHTKGFERQACVNAFQSDDSIRVAILSILAAGVGLTLTAAKLVVFAELYWTPGVMIQCEDRAHRIGQVDSLPIHYLVAKNTMDEWVWSAVRRKTYVTSTALSGKSKPLEHNEGESYQIDVLSNADMWKTNDGDEEMVDVSELIKTQRAPDQPSILGFLSPSRKVADNTTSLKTLGSGTKHKNKFAHVNKITDSLGQSKKPPLSNRKGVQLEEVIILDSDDEEDFKLPSKKRKNSEDRLGKINKVNKKSKKHITDQKDKSGENSSGQSTNGESNDLRIREEINVTSTDIVSQSPSNTSSKHAHNKMNEKSDDELEVDEDSNLSLVSNVGQSHYTNACQQNEKETTPLRKTSQWNCSLCTFKNHADLPSCEICDSPKKNVTKSKSGRKTVLPGSEDKNVIVIENSNSGVNSNSDIQESCVLEFHTVHTSAAETHSHNLLGEEKDNADQDRDQCLPEVNEDRSHNDTMSASCSYNGNGTHSLTASGKETDRGCHPPNEAIVASSKPAGQGRPSIKSSSSLSPLTDDGDACDSKHNSHHKVLKFCCSMHTGRIFVYSEQGESIQANFFPIDVELGNTTELSPLLREPYHLKLIQRFVREWTSLADTKKKLIAKRGLVFVSPNRASEEVRSVQGIKQRHMTKNDLQTAMEKAKDREGSVRSISHPNQSTSDKLPALDTNRGVNQIIDTDGVPLCLQCEKPYTNVLLPKQMISSSENAWLMRLCSYACMDKYWTLNHAGYCRDQLYDIERGVCQLCQFGAHEFYSRMKVIKDLKKRAEILRKSPSHKLCSSLREKMVLNPVPGQFWHADHITPVWQGGGMCDIDNLRTLCTPCHTKVTSKQAGQRATARKLSSAASSGNIAAFFQR